MIKQALIIGYGYCGQYLAQELVDRQIKVTAWSRTPPSHHLAITHQAIDLDQLTHHAKQALDKKPYHQATVYYLAPPPNHGQHDTRLQAVLPYLTHAAHIIYISSSGVYGLQAGDVVNENTKPKPDSARAQRRLDAEQQLIAFCHQYHIPLGILRSAGIYGPGRIPLQSAQMQKPLIKKTQAPFVNLIFVGDIVRVCLTLPNKLTLSSNTIYNLCDGKPQYWGHSQRLLAQQLELTPAPEINLDDYLATNSPMVQSFIRGNKQLSNAKLQTLLGSDFQFTPLTLGLKKSYQKQL